MRRYEMGMSLDYVRDWTLSDAVREIFQNEVFSSDEDRYSENRQKKAIELVKKHWGEDDTVSFICDHVTEDGEYMIAVISNSFFEVQNYFRVNLENNTVYLEY